MGVSFLSLAKSNYQKTISHSNASLVTRFLHMTTECTLLSQIAIARIRKLGGSVSVTRVLKKRA